VLILAGRAGRLALFQSIGWVPGNNLAYVEVVPRSRVRVVKLVRSEFWRIRLRLGALLTRRGVTNESGYAMDGIGRRNPS
jgi:hypothetical protein